MLFPGVLSGLRKWTKFFYPFFFLFNNIVIPMIEVSATTTTTIGDCGAGVHVSLNSCCVDGLYYRKGVSFMYAEFSETDISRA